MAARLEMRVLTASALVAAVVASTAQAREVHWVRVGDLSGDGVGERVACDPAADGGAGMVEVFDGATGALIVRFTGDPGAQFGAAASEVGDVNGDGLPELLVGAPGQQRAYLIDSPFADVADPVVSSTRLAFVLEPPAGISTVGFGSDVAGIHDLDGDEVPDLRVAAVVTDADGTTHSQSFVFQGITGATIGIGRRAGLAAGLEAAAGDTDRDVAVDARDMMTVVEGLGAASPAGPSDGDVTLDGAVDGADVAVVLQALGTRLYRPVAVDPGLCAAGTFEVDAQGESICVEVVATSTLAAEIVTGIAPTGPIDPSLIIHPLPNDCGNKIAACLGDPRVIAAAQVVMSRCWPGGTPNTVIGYIYCVPCGPTGLPPSSSDFAVYGVTVPTCGPFYAARVNITLCSCDHERFCEALAHELVHVSQACSLGLFVPSVSCASVILRWNDRRSVVCRELEAYASTSDCADPSLHGCCELSCKSARRFWQHTGGNCDQCCKHLIETGCCNGGLLVPNCVNDLTGPCPDGRSHGF